MRRIRVRTREIIRWADPPRRRPMRPITTADAGAHGQVPRPAFELPRDLDPDRYGDFDFQECLEAEPDDDPMSAPIPRALNRPPT